MKIANIFTPKLFVFLPISLLLLLFLSVNPLKVRAENTSSTNIPSSYVSIGNPHAMVMVPDGTLWYVDNLNTRIVLMNPTNNTIIRTVGRMGSAEGEFQEGLTGITRDSEGNLYLLHIGCVVNKLDSNGGFISRTDLKDTDASCWAPRDIHFDSFSGSLLVTYETGKVAKFSTNFDYISSFGSEGSDDGQFSDPFGITTDINGRIYVADNGNNRVQVFAANYTHLFNAETSWADIDGTTAFDLVYDVSVALNGTITATNRNGHSLEQFNSSGTHINTVGYHNDGGLADMINPESLARDSSGNLYVSDTWIKSVNKFTSTGVFISTMRNSLLDNGKFYFPNDFDYDASGDLYVLDHESRVQKFTNSGTYIDTLVEVGEFGLAEASTNLAIGPDGKLYVSSRWDIRVFTEDEGNWTLTDTIEGVFGEQAWGGLGGFAFSGDDLFVPNMQNTNVLKYTINMGGTYDYVSSFGGGWDHESPALDSQLTSPYGVAIGSNGHIYVADWNSLKEFSAAGVFLGNLGVAGVDFQTARGISVDPNNGNLYLTDSWGSQIFEYDDVTGTKLSRIGSTDGLNYAGSGQLQFFRPQISKINPTTDTLVIADTENSRMQKLQNGNRILNLIPSAEVVRLDAGFEGQSLSSQSWVPSVEDPLTDIPARLLFGDYVVADFSVDLSTGDLDWVAVNLFTLPNNSTSLVVNLNQTDAPGISAEHSLYIIRYANQHSVTVCPAAEILSEVNAACDGMYTLNENDPGLTAITDLNGKDYWKIDGLTGTGAFSLLFNTSFALSDQMTRQKVSTASNHLILFGTTYNLTHADDTISLTFSADWDMSALTISDISLKRGVSTLAIADDGPDEDVWGVTWAGNQIVFTAPTSGTLQYIDANNTISVVLSNEAVINPDVTGSYAIDIRMESDTEPGPADVEVGSINVTIVDSDQVNVTSYINTFINFDLDTTTVAATHCDYDACPIHAGAGAADGANYTVDLGELNSTWINKSNDAEIMHSDNIEGLINSIYMDLTTNAANGAIVTVVSANAGLESAGIANNRIESVTDGADIGTNSGLYGFQMPSDPANTGNGTIETNSNCTTTLYCALTTSQNEVFNTSSLPLDNGRIRMDLAASAAYTNNPGSYTDTLTFIAVPEY